MSRLVGPRQVLSFIGPWQMLSFIGPELTITGDIACDGDVEIVGTVNGNVKARELRISRRGRLNGAAEARTAVIDGVLDGSLTADKVTLGTKAQVTGDIKYGSFAMAAGAVFMGYSERIESGSAAEPSCSYDCGTEASPDSRPQLIFHGRVAGTAHAR